MREIKFRAWDKEKRRMLPVTLMEFNQWWVSCMPISESNGSVLEYGERNSFRNEETDRHILMQYTGLEDMNKKEICEGDIIRANAIDEPSIGIVFYSDGGFKCTSDFAGIKNFEVYDELNHDLITDNDMEVVGNIYEQEVK
jgi:uncharacterized phage protein (TIGR01671 family)